ncbi:DUF222 domain-containing protein [Actinoplanes sp. M2I2]|uniref:DUF222 domain-containing protein n=1 Tax=Actinoplanes sp. M2I2 TaxID=1734444 RepID=UPI0035B1E911
MSISTPVGETRKVSYACSTMVPVMADVRQLSEKAATLAATPLWPLANDDLTACLKAAHRLEQCAAALQARLAQQATTRGLPTAQGHRNTAAWLRRLLLLDPQPARELAAQAAALSRRPAVQQAVLDGHLNLRQSTVIAETLDALPKDLTHHNNSNAHDSADAHDHHDGGDCRQDAQDGAHDDHDGGDCRQDAHDGAHDDHDGGDCRQDAHDGAGGVYQSHGDGQGGGDSQNGDRHDSQGCGPGGEHGVSDVSRLVELAQTTMIGMAERLPAYQLRRVGERILAHVAPELAERADEAALARQEARAHRRRKFTLSLPSDGLVRVSGLLGTEDAAIMHAALHPLCTPIPGDDSTAEHRRADALIDICRLALRTGELPADGGEPPQLAVTVPYDLLTRIPLAGVSGLGLSRSGSSRTETSRSGSSRTVTLSDGDSHAVVVGAGSSRVGTSGDSPYAVAMGGSSSRVGTSGDSPYAVAVGGSSSHVGTSGDSPHAVAVGGSSSHVGTSRDSPQAIAAGGVGSQAGTPSGGGWHAGTLAADRSHAYIVGSGGSHAGTSGRGSSQSLTLDTVPLDTVPMDTLVLGAGTLGMGTTDTGHRLSAATMRRLACDARILPFVLGGAGQILDTGRARRLATGPLRRALHVRDQGCAFPDCDRPPRWTDAHHLIAWTSGGRTSLDNLVLLCRHHHRLIHHPGGGWQIRLGADQRPDFYPPPTIDPLRRPRRNIYHRRR